MFDFSPTKFFSLLWTREAINHTIWFQTMDHACIMDLKRFFYRNKTLSRSTLNWKNAAYNVKYRLQKCRRKSFVCQVVCALIFFEDIFQNWKKPQQMYRRLKLSGRWFGFEIILIKQFDWINMWIWIRIFLNPSHKANF